MSTMISRPLVYARGGRHIAGVHEVFSAGRRILKNQSPPSSKAPQHGMPCI